MNPPSNAPGQQGNPSWVVTDTWDHPTSNNNSGAAGNQYQGGGARPAEWDWDNQMLLVQQTPAAASAEVDADRKPQVLSVVPTATLCNNRPYGGGNFSTPQSFQQHTAIMGNNFNPPSSIRSYGLDFASEYHGHPSSLHTGLVSSLGQPAATPSELNAELRSYDQRRRFLGMHMLGPEHKNVLDFVKREDMYSMGDAAHARIGLNLGGRTHFSAEDSARLGKRSRINSLTHAPMCQVQGCTADLGKAKHYHRRHKVCEIHSKAPNVIANGQTQRFCQQCSRFHQLSEFDDTKRSCRKRLADHNRRRRKPQHSAVVTISESFKTEEQSTNMRAFEGDHKSILINMQKSGSPSASITDRGSISSGGNRLQNNNQPPTFGTVDDKLVNRSSLLRGQAMPSSDVQALVLSVVSRTPSSAQSTRQSPGTQESVYQHYLHGPSLSLSSAGMGAAQAQHNSPSGQSYSSMEPSVPWLGSPSGSRSTLVQARSLQGFPPGRDNQHLQHCNPQYMLQPTKSSDWVTREQLGRLGLQSVQGSMDGHQMLALIENPGQHLHSSVHDVKPLQHSEMQSSGVRSSFGSSFYDSSSSIG